MGISGVSGAAAGDAFLFPSFTILVFCSPLPEPLRFSLVPVTFFFFFFVFFFFFF